MSVPATQSSAIASPTLRSLTAEFLTAEAKMRLGGGKSAIERQHEKGRLTARERISGLIDPGSFLQELGLWAAHGMYAEHGGAPAAGVVTGIGVIHGRRCMIIANDATVKAGAFFPMTCKKIIRAQTVAMQARMPLVYLVDSAGVFLPLQEDVFPDTDDFGRIFRNNAVISAMGIPQIAAIMGFCVAGGGYLPVLCDTLLMTEGSGLYLAGPALVKAAIGQSVTDEELGGAQMHAQISGTIDFREPTDQACLARLRSLLNKYAPLQQPGNIRSKLAAPATDPERIYEIFADKPGSQYDVRDLIACIVDPIGKPNEHGHTSPAPDFDEYKAEYGQSLVCGYARIGGHPVGIVANQRKLVVRTTPGAGGPAGKATQMPGVIYDDSADKTARFIMDCNQRKIPLVFLHDTTGFMVGRDSEQGGIIRAGAKMVNAMSNCVVPKLVVIAGGSYGAGNYAMCGRAFDQFLSFAWPGSRCAVMGANQATGVLAMIEEKSRERKGETIDEATHKQILAAVHASYSEQQDIRHGAARGWVDRIIEPHRTRDELITALDAAQQGWDYAQSFRTGVLQV
ncbi:MAG: acyl-CoA carboxylase subunit beta [Planctomycetaceae bacterium]|jgi:3-methylcrotonyl-CoA carboxylase beta subunit|nr:acyl-CoA carboxylase subunit beta [Phycisphaerales bacterium]MCE2651979.1 acyl-CoA carboxylase subunit beta [Planctomycetaceae bacterium]